MHQGLIFRIFICLITFFGGTNTLADSSLGNRSLAAVSPQAKKSARDLHFLQSAKGVLGAEIFSLYNQRTENLPAQLNEELKLSQRNYIDSIAMMTALDSVHAQKPRAIRRAVRRHFDKERKQLRSSEKRYRRQMKRSRAPRIREMEASLKGYRSERTRLEKLFKRPTAHRATLQAKLEKLNASIELLKAKYEKEKKQARQEDRAIKASSSRNEAQLLAHFERNERELIRILKNQLYNIEKARSVLEMRREKNSPDGPRVQMLARLKSHFVNKNQELLQLINQSHDVLKRWKVLSPQTAQSNDLAVGKLSEMKQTVETHRALRDPEEDNWAPFEAQLDLEARLSSWVAALTGGRSLVKEPQTPKAVTPVLGSLGFAPVRAVSSR